MSTSGVPRQPLIRSAEELDKAVAGLPERFAELVVRLEHADLLRPLTLLPDDVTVIALDLTVAGWRRPHRNWNGRAGRLPGLLSLTVSYPEQGEEQIPGDARVLVRLEEPAALADVTRAVFSLVAVDRGLHGYAAVEIGAAEAPVAALGLLPGRTSLGTPGPPSHHLLGLGLPRVDVGLVAAVPQGDEVFAGPDDPEVVRVATPLVVDARGHLAAHDRVGRPLVDLNVHNPINRLHTFDEAPGSLALDLDGDRLTWRPVGPSTAELPTWSRPANLPLSGAEVARLAPVEELDLSSLGDLDVESQQLLGHRLAELAATGVILHSLPPGLAALEDALGTTLTTLLRQPYRSTTGLVRELRTVPQRREAMLRFGGFYELADSVATLGHRILPSVSVVLSSMRASRATAVVEALGRQTYPHLEIAIALHGDAGERDPEFERAVHEAGAVVSEHDASVPFGTVLAQLAARTTGDLVVKIDDDDVYGPRVIEDLVLAYLYSNADVVGKTTEYLYFENIDLTVHRRFQTERYHPQVAGGAMMLSRAALTEIGGWRPSRSSTDRSILIRLGNMGGVGYRTQSLGYVYVRHLDGHTWHQADSRLLRKAPEQWPRFLREIIDA